MHFIKSIVKFLVLSTIVCLVTGCATQGPTGPTTVSESASLAYSIKDVRGELLIAVSPTGRAMRIGGTTTGVVGAGIEAPEGDALAHEVVGMPVAVAGLSCGTEEQGEQQDHRRPPDGRDTTRQHAKRVVRPT